MAKTNGDKALEVEQVCRILVRKGIISQTQAKEVLARENDLRNKLEKIRSLKGIKGFYSSAGGQPVTGVDIVCFLQLKRCDAPDKVVDEETVFQALASEWGIPYKKIDPLKLDLNLVTDIIPHTFAMKHLVVPIGMKEECLIVATPNPFNLEVLEDIARVTKYKVNPVVSTKSDVLRIIEEFYGFKRSIAAAEHQFAGSPVDLGNLEQFVRLTPAGEVASNDQHIVNAVNHLFSYAFDQRASDVHIEPKRDVSVVRMRIDGVLHTVYRLPKAVHSAIVSRIKNLSRLDMAEKRRPQDGRIKTGRGETEAEIRVSTVPVAFGEKVVMRIMDPEILFQDLDQLGFSAQDLERYEKFIHMPHGIVLVCGPTGSGKSTTLYSTLRYLSSPEVNIVTVEDPIEMVYEEFNQIAVQPAVGITFGTILRNILRQDPDIIMIGEMRDKETAEHAIQAALTGHLVLSTLHTNDAASSVTRLLDLGIPAFLIQATLVGVVAQRLVRTICGNCKEPVDVPAERLERLGINVKERDHLTLYRGKGCVRCRGTGYHGRTGIFEVLPYSEQLKKLTTPDAKPSDIKSQAMKEGMVTLRENAARKLLEGITTYEEVLRVTWEGSAH
ncbi:MAG: type II/IV secretion system protein [Deltaproteobacteria bacterium]|nr:MAG: type II/IV secretion system protein [Deltaproteobacteria bacterium]